MFSLLIVEKFCPVIVIFVAPAKPDVGNQVIIGEAFLGDSYLIGGVSSFHNQKILLRLKLKLNKEYFLFHFLNTKKKIVKKICEHYQKHQMV